MIEIKLPKQRLAMTESEFMELLRGRPDLWATALRRGKAFSRHEREVARTRQVFVKH
ncbi:Hypothetical protein DEACI_3130 [Acididesulfobacillus acetoxydans]|uniref:Uncharacterized protein n=1 Tax=Acididesulfobacillus acetoxydans TaxID=1561005 RepID=A0A8S0XCH4_9FIRM|nr:Hypothetical protein DEACI_3130 [Acididesulfobacillus acetoxydans]CEJ05911.1 Hypothetical protein DEACI_0331 [Acididesulfobacillus acetoxydans]